MRIARSRNQPSVGLNRITRSALGIATFLIAVIASTTTAGGSEPADTYWSTVASDAPAAQYRFSDAVESGTLADSVGSDTAATSGIALAGTGPFPGSKSGALDGEAFAVLTDDPLDGVGEFTAEAWVDWSGGASYGQPIFDFGSNATDHLYLTPASTLAEHELAFVIESSSESSSQVTAPALKADGWHFLAVTETSAGTLTLYLDGEQVGQVTEQTLSPASLGTAADAYLGKSLASAPGFHGSLSNVAFYTKALSAARIKAHFAAGEFPVDATVPTVSGVAEDEAELMAHAEDWTGLAPIEFGYQWLRCDGTGESCSNISGATTARYSAGFGDVGHRLRVRLNASNTAGSGEAVSAATDFIAPTPLTELGYSSEFGSEGSGDGEFKQPYGVSVGADGDVFVLDRGNDRVEKFNEANEYLGQFGSEGLGDGQMREPHALAADSKGHVWVLDSGNERIEEFSEHGEFLRTAGEGLIGNAEGLAIDHSDRVWVSVTYQGHLAVFGEEGEHLKDVELTPSWYGGVAEPEGLTVDASGHVWVAEWAGRVEEFDEAGEPLSQFGSEGFGVGYLNGAFGIAVDTGHVFVSEAGYVQEFDEEGAFIAQLGAPGPESGHFESAEGLAIDPAHDLLIADAGKSHVQKWSPEAPGAPANLVPPSISGTPGVGSTLATTAGAWAGSPRRSYGYQWQRCNESGEECLDITGATSPTHVAVSADLGDTLRVFVTATNSSGSASSTSSPTEPIGMRPVNTSPPTISGTMELGQELTADVGTWEGASGYFVQWERCNEHGEGCLPIEAWGETYTAKAADVGSTLRVIVYTWNSAGEGSATSEATSMIRGGAPPSNTSLPTITGTPEEGGSLSASPGSWEGAEPISFAYQWQRCDSLGEECASIEAASEEGYVPTEDDVGHTLRVIVAASNATGEASATSLPSEVVTASSVIENDELPSISGVAQDGQTLTASQGTWRPGSSLTYAYQWESCDEHGEDCADIEGATSATYLLAEADVGHTLRVAVTATGPLGSATAASEPTGSVTPIIPPTNTEAPAITGVLANGRTVSAEKGVWTTPHAPLTYSYQWRRCNGAGASCSDIAGATSSGYTIGSEDTGGHTLRVVITATDSLGVSASGSSGVRYVSTAVRVTEYAYDANGNLKSRTDGNGHATTYAYGPDNEQTVTEQADGSSTETGYNGDGLVTSQTDGNGHTTKYARNVLGEVTEVTDPLGRKTTKKYDPAGNLTSLTDPSARMTTYRYDPANRLLETTYSDGTTPNVEYEYDADGNKTKMLDGTGTSIYHYDKLDRLTEATDGHGDSTAYEYDLAGDQTQITYPGGNSVGRSFDAEGRLESVRDWLGSQTSFAYDPDSNLTAIAYPEGTAESDRYAYNFADQMSEATFAKGEETLASLSYGRDSEGQVAGTTSGGLPGAESTLSTYDPANRLTKDGASAYEYDGAGNATKLGESTAAYDEGSQLEHVAGTSYSFDEEGQRTKITPSSGPATSYGYDQAGNLTSVERGGEGETPAIEDSYAYDGDGLRTSQASGETTKQLTWDQSGGLPLILGDGSYSFVYGPADAPLEQIDSEGHVTYLHNDQQGSVRMLSGEDGSVEGKSSYDAYGSLAEHTGSATSPLGYDGQYTNPDTGLIYLRARVYDPATAQFLSVDPLVTVSTTSYGYAAGNPLSYVDPSGLIFGIPGTPSWGDIGTRFVGFWDGFTKPVFGGTAALRSFLGWNGGLDTCSSEYQGARAWGKLDVSLEAGALGGGLAEGATRIGLARYSLGAFKVGPIAAPLVGGGVGGTAQTLVAGNEPTPTTVGQGVVGGLVGELATGLVPGTSASGVAGGVNTAFGFVW
jgi:RHS repeat-associated protein